MAESGKTTGRYLVLLRQDHTDEGIQELQRMTGASIVSAGSTSYTQERQINTLEMNCAVVFDQIGVALIRCELEVGTALQAAAAQATGNVLLVEAERTVHAIAISAESPGHPPASDEGQGATWGVRACGADHADFTGKGIRLAVLDTGLDLSHPDFAQRPIQSRSFVSGAEVQDQNGHGTHCAGIAAGLLKPAGQPRYGVAADALLYIGKVLGNDGSGGDGSVLDGINWAIGQGCEIISLSLGSPAAAGDHYSQIFEEVAKRALAAGTLIIAAAGNESRRPDFIAPVSHPANCPSIVAVAAVDEHMAIAPFSCGGLQQDGGQVEIAAPGVAVFSSWPAPDNYNTISGTSMATPFVAGVAALYAEAGATARGSLLRDQILQNARPLPLPVRDVGSGLVQAPGRHGSVNGHGLDH
ncbi:protease [Advenella kashmirensis W13003]|uniref:Protease n=1 Tax=Advenella kashmirensis W13003 TaxID=1424334 RepID=V8QPB6_9BURK|nr:S8 family serine peptidase [Advenella kashmirensis]ETF01482.1 protease [Advenella kashmirensis W13003]